METHTPMDTEPISRTGARAFLSANQSNSLFARVERWLVRTGDGTLRHTHETARAVRRRLNLSPRQYKKRLKAAKRSGLSLYLQPFLRREVAPPAVPAKIRRRRVR